MAKRDLLNRIYEFYTSDLSIRDVERLIKRDAPQVYDFYVRRMKKPEETKKSRMRILLFLRNLFVEFLLKLTPIRRLFYSLALMFFIVGFLMGLWNWALLSFLMLNLLIAFELADKLTAKDELAVARDIQSSLMPGQAPQNEFYDIACYYESAREVGGDYYDFICPETQPDKTYLVVGDISGKGVGAALHMLQVQAILRFIVNQCQDPRNILCLLNKTTRNILKPDNFFTATLALFESGKPDLLISRAGHTPLLHFQAAHGKAVNIVPMGMGIGFRDGGMFDKVLEEITVVTEPGDILIFYTDGVTEMMDSHRNLFGDEALRQLVEKNAFKTVSEIQETILHALSRFRDYGPANDDMTLIILKRKK
ncbi:MAG: PP2C family protein-serine/threonine phosphatase [Ignavibacteriales bacterium]